MRQHKFTSLLGSLAIASSLSLAACDDQSDWAPEKGDRSGPTETLSYAEAREVQTSGRDQVLNFQFQATDGDEILITATASSESASDPALVLYDRDWLVALNDDCTDCETDRKDARVATSIDTTGLHDIALHELAGPGLIELKLECVSGPCAE